MWDLNRLRLLRELQLRGTIAAVATSLDYSPSNVSQQLSQLEREVGTKLLEPDGRRLRLTAAGMAIARHAEQIMTHEERTRLELNELSASPMVLRVATIASATRALLPRALDIIAAQATHPRVELFVVPPEHGLAELETRHYDLVVAEQYPGHTRERRDGVDYQHLGNDPIRVVLPSNSTAESLHDLRDTAWVLEPEGSAARYWAVQQCRAAGFEPDVQFEATDLDTHIALIASGHAVGILPNLIWAGHEPPLKLIDLPTPLERDLFTAVRASASDGVGIQILRSALTAAFLTAPKLEDRVANRQTALS
jgi:DNA-binding transcriptional LysR family regulator